MGTWPENGRFIFCTLISSPRFFWLELFCAQFLTEVFLILSPRLELYFLPQISYFSREAELQFLTKIFLTSGRLLYSTQHCRKRVTVKGSSSPLESCSNPWLVQLHT